jgi:hypothetical protein
MEKPGILRLAKIPSSEEALTCECTGVVLRRPAEYYIPRSRGLVTDDYVLVNSNASVENKAQFLADFLLPGFRIEPYVVEEPIQKVWDGGAVLGGLVHLKWTQDGKHQTRTLRVSYVWAKRDGRWQVTYTQVTRVSE